MARTYYVKRAQQRYHTKPVLNEDGTPKVSPVLRKDGTPKTTKRGREITMAVTVRDLDRPKPMPKCSKCDHEVKVGEPYKYTETYNRTIFRCQNCPPPQVWEYSSSLSARIAQIQHEGSSNIDAAGCPEDLTGYRDEIAQNIRDLAAEKGEAADNMEEGFGHETYQSADIRQQSEDLESWADEIEQWEPNDDAPDPVCEACDGSGKVEVEPYEDGPADCDACQGTGEVPPEYDDRYADWIEDLKSELRDLLESSPI